MNEHLPSTFDSFDLAVAHARACSAIAHDPVMLVQPSDCSSFRVCAAGPLLHTETVIAICRDGKVVGGAA